MPRLRVGVVGAGIIGLAVAQRLAARDVSVTVLEKEDRVATHQTSHSSGVAHAGLYYAPGSLKARLCRRGIGLLEQFCAEHGLRYVACGKLVVAVTAREVAALDEIRRRARANGVPGLRWLTGARLREVEPHVTGVAALHSPSTAIVDFPAVARALAAEVTRAGGEVRLKCEVAWVRHSGSRVRVGGWGEELEFDRLVTCAGLHADRVARLAGDRAEPAVVPFRGEYLRLKPDRRDLVSGLIYPVPDPRYPFLGVHFTRRVDGNVDVGPNAVLALAREGYRWRDMRPRELWETLAWPGFRRLAGRHWRTGVAEVYGSLSRRAFVARARRFVPELAVDDVEPAPAGVRAQAVDRDGSLVDDFRISRIGPVVAVRNAPSPAATSSLAIAERVADEVLAGA